MLAKAHPCPTCGCDEEPCLRHSINFADPPDGTTVPGFTEVSGDWEIAGLLTIADNNAILICDDEVEDGHGVVVITGDVTSSGGKLWAIGSYVDSSNFLYLKVTFHATTGRGELWKRESGTDTQLSTADVDLAYPTGTVRTLTLCWDGTNARAYISTDGNGQQLFWKEPYTGTGTKAGIGFQTPGGANINTFTLNRHAVDHGDCPACTSAGSCPGCNGNPPNMGWDVQVPALTNGTCSDCADYAGTYSFDAGDLKSYRPGDDGVGYCVWRKEITDHCGTGNAILSIHTFEQAGVGTENVVNFALNADNFIANWGITSVAGGWPGGCYAFSSTSVPATIGSGADCSTTAPLTVTAT